MSAFRMAKLWFILARRRFSINGLFVRFAAGVLLVLLDESCVFDDAAGESVAVDDGDKGAWAMLIELDVFEFGALEFVSKWIWFHRISVFVYNNRLFVIFK